MKSIKVNSIRFDETGFRKLADLEIPISPRITVIGGHNGIGKSSILGLIANSSATADISYFDKTFRSEFNEIFYLDIDKELKPVSERGYLYIDYFIEHKDGTSEKFIKRSSIGANSKTDPITGEKFYDRLRVIPRSVDEARSKELNLSVAGKMPIPTIYLGMSRITPIGEIDIHNFEKKEVRGFQVDDKKYFEEAFKSVIDFDKNKDRDYIIDHNVKASKKKSKLPNTDHSTLAISLGQDSLSSVITALTSFHKLRRELKEDYIGGLLIIDEAEAGLHPRAQIKLMELLVAEANNLNLQVLLTSHSLTIMRFIFDSQSPRSTKIMDSVVYLADTRVPQLYKDVTYTKIKYDMLLLDDLDRTNPVIEKKIKVYFEDDEAKYFYEKIIEYKGLENSQMSFGVEIEPISLKVGSEILIKLVKSDDYFLKAVLIADNDVASKSTNKKVIDEHVNFCVLPPSNQIKDNSPAKTRTPEFLIYKFIEDRFKDPKSHREFWRQSDTYTTDYVKDHVLYLDEKQKLDRDEMKKWFNKSKKYFDERKILHLWCIENSKQVEKFISELTVGVDEATKNLDMAKVG